MNRFELLELMYRLVVENENLTQRCSELEAMLDTPQRSGGTVYRHNTGMPQDEPRTYPNDREAQPSTRREEVMARVNGQTSRPQPPREATPQQSNAPSRRRASAGSAAAAPAARAKPKEVPAAAKHTESDSLDLDSILQDYFREMNFEQKGRNS